MCRTGRDSAGDDDVHRDVVRLGMRVWHELVGETNADFQSIGLGLGKQAIVEPAPTTEAAALGIEGEAWAEKGVDFRWLHFREAGCGFQDAKGSRNQIPRRIRDDVEAELLAIDARIDPAQAGAGECGEFCEIGFAGQGGENGDGSKLLMCRHPFIKRAANWLRVSGFHEGDRPHAGAEEFFRGDGIGNCHLPRRVVLPCLAAVKGLLQAATILSLGTAIVRADEGKRAFVWDGPKVVKSAFTQDLGMLDSERDEYATNLASIAVNQLVAAKASETSLDDARKMLALALHLSPRNKRAVVVNFQLSRGVLPDAVEGNYSTQVFARLILTRGQLLEKQGGDENKRLARYFIQLAASLDPKNEDVVYASELQRLDHGAVDWAPLMAGGAMNP